MDNLEQYVKSKLEKRYDVLVAIFTEKPRMIDSVLAKKWFRQYELEILNGKHPSFLQDTTGIYYKAFIFGATSYMKEDAEYLEKFLNACKDSEGLLREIIGIKL